LTSFDGRQNWKKWSGSSWDIVTDSDPTTWNTITEMQAGFPYTVNVSDVGMDLKFAFKTTSITKTPSVDTLMITYDEVVRFDAATIGTSGQLTTDVQMARLTPETTMFRNNGSANQFIVNALIS
jgi:hypothetical protein